MEFQNFHSTVEISERERLPFERGEGGGTGCFPNMTNLFEPSELPESHQNKKET